MRNIIFVGLHNKPDMMPLDIISRSGKIINKLIKRFSNYKYRDLVFIKTNLFDTEYLPINGNEIDKEVINWHYRINYNSDDIIVLLGSEVQKRFINRLDNKIIKLPHPASFFYSGKKDVEYIQKAFDKIKMIL